MSTIIRDINGNKLTLTHRHLANRTANITSCQTDSTGLVIIGYTNDEQTKHFSAFIRPETATEKNTVALAKKTTPKRPV